MIRGFDKRYPAFSNLGLFHRGRGTRGKTVRRRFVLAVLISGLLCPLALTACGGGDQKEVVLVTDFAENEIFRIEDKSCVLEEADIYMQSSGNRYQSVFGEGIWTRNLGGKTLGQELKNMTLSRLAQIKSMNLLAESRGVSLDEEEVKKAEEAAALYLASKGGESSAKKDQKEGGGGAAGASVSKLDLIERMYCEYALADKVYHEITKDINPEISDDEARSITVNHILIKTHSQKDNGEKVEFNEEEKAKARDRAEEALAAAREGEDFEVLIDRYSEDDKRSYTFSKGTMPEAFEKAAFNLGTGEISDIVETEYGYHIIQCVSTFDQEETDANKARMIRKRKSEEFNRVYVSFVKEIRSYLNEALWDTVECSSEVADGGNSFFLIYDQVFGNE
ncbi:MAG: peptidyl-prolyl cis-trans isomerase [Lachnospiraceae bacterium]|nr:peptidyl-prolyl cis-trans isomerase [Lachnospiraceae bacterium]